MLYLGKESVISEVMGLLSSEGYRCNHRELHGGAKEGPELVSQEGCSGPHGVSSGLGEGVCAAVQS